MACLIRAYSLSMVLLNLRRRATSIIDMSYARGNFIGCRRYWKSFSVLSKQSLITLSASILAPDVLNSFLDGDYLITV